MKKPIYFSVFFGLLATIAVAQGSVRFEAEADARQIVLSGFFSVTFTLHNANSTDIRFPDFKDFQALGRPSQSTSVQIINGRRSQSVGFTYQLQPTKVGKFTIGSASVTIDGTTYRTNPITIEVVKGKNSTATTRKDLDAEMGTEVFIKAEPSTNEARIGEQILLDYKLYTTRDIETYNLLSESEYQGFFAQDIRRYNGQVIKEVVDGKQFSTKILKRVALFPQQAGAMTIEPMMMQLYVITESSGKRRSIFFRPKMTPIRVNTEPLQINVSPLPPDAPETFSGAVGKYTLRTSINRNEMTTDDALSLRMEITGTGDVKQVQAPSLGLSENFEVYDPKVLEESSYENKGQLLGKKVLEYLIIAKEPGNYDLAFGFTYFDSDSLKYITLQSDTSRVKVTKGVLGDRKIARTSGSTDVNEDIRFIKTNATFSQKNDPFLGSGWFWTFFAMPLVFLGGVLIMKRRQAGINRIDPAILKKRRAKKIAQKRLASAKKFLDNQDSKAFYDEISKAAFGYICDKLSIPFSELTKDNIIEKLNSLQVSQPSIDSFMKTIKTCEMALFAGKDNTSAMQETYQEAIAVIMKIEEEIGT